MDASEDYKVHMRKLFFDEEFKKVANDKDFASYAVKFLTTIQEDRKLDIDQLEESKKLIPIIARAKIILFSYMFHLTIEQAFPLALEIESFLHEKDLEYDVNYLEKLYNKSPEA